MQILNIAGYKFIELTDLDTLRPTLQARCAALLLKGTILVSPEGININLAGLEPAIQEFKAALALDPRFTGLLYHHTYSSEQPFKFMKVKLRKEIITLRQGDVAPSQNNRAPDISPAELKKWLDENRDITLLDTRNDFEYQYGRFAGSVNLHINNFGEFPEAMKQLDKQKPVVMVCTGGIRCEKAAIYMQNQGYSEVYQLDGGILGYFAEAGGAHYEGDCFVFDERVALNPEMKYRRTP